MVEIILINGHTYKVELPKQTLLENIKYSDENTFIQTNEGVDVRANQIIEIKG